MSDAGGSEAVEAPTECVLVRHGETTGNSAIRLYGATDIPLSERGRAQMRKVAEALSKEVFDRLVTSPLSRSRESGAIIAPQMTPIVVPELTEIDFGRWEGWTFEEARTRDPVGHAAWGSEGLGFRFPGGEERAGFHQRIRDVVPRVLGGPGGTLGVLHKGVIKVALAALLDVPIAVVSDLPVDLGGIHRLRLTPDGWMYTARNEIAHLGADRTPDGAT